MIPTHRLRLNLCLRLALAVLVLCLVGVGCASQGLKPGTGDISFRLHWEGDLDLDLHVVDPLDRHTGMTVFASTGTPEDQLSAIREALAARIEAERNGGPDAPPAGILDVDCNASPNQICVRPIENVFWPAGTAPHGRYAFWVHLFQPILETSGQREVAFTLEVRRGDEVVELLRGVLNNDSRTSTTFEHVF